MSYNVYVSLPESLLELAARNVGFTVENIHDKNCDLVMDGKARFEACITDEDCWIYAIVMRSNSWNYQDELEKRLRSIYTGDEEIEWYEPPNQ